MCCPHFPLYPEATGGWERQQWDGDHAGEGNVADGGTIKTSIAHQSQG